MEKFQPLDSIQCYGQNGTKMAAILIYFDILLGNHHYALIFVKPNICDIHVLNSLMVNRKGDSHSSGLCSIPGLGGLVMGLVPTDICVYKLIV